jgi:hypothetical protein
MITKKGLRETTLFRARSLSLFGNNPVSFPIYRRLSINDDGQYPIPLPDNISAGIGVSIHLWHELLLVDDILLS